MGTKQLQDKANSQEINSEINKLRDKLNRDDTSDSKRNKNDINSKAVYQQKENEENIPLSAIDSTQSYTAENQMEINIEEEQKIDVNDNELKHINQQVVLNEGSIEDSPVDSIHSIPDIPDIRDINVPDNTDIRDTDIPDIRNTDIPDIWNTDIPDIWDTDVTRDYKSKTRQQRICVKSGDVEIIRIGIFVFVYIDNKFKYICIKLYTHLWGLRAIFKNNH